MRIDVGTVYRLYEPTEAWNVDGSSDAVADLGSHIKDAEAATGRKRGRCSFEDCNSPAEVGGHIWIKKTGCFIAPICKKCNFHANRSRMQGAGARLRANIDVTKAKQTEGMKTATRNIALPNRDCEECGADITDKPDEHSLCLSCFRQLRKGGNSQASGRKRVHRCESCGTDISDQPDDHDQCLSCFRGRGQSQASGRKRVHRCKSCKTDISDQPDDHDQCLSCFRERDGRFGKRARRY